MPITQTGYITIQDSPGNVRAYDAYYDRKQSPFKYTETLDASHGRTKTGQLILFADDDLFVAPQEDQIIKIYRHKVSPGVYDDLMFGGVISRVDEEVVSRDPHAVSPEVTWVKRYTLKVDGYDPYTLRFREVTDYERIGILSGQAIKELLELFAPWVDTTNVEVATSPLIQKIHIERRDLATVLNSILEKTDWTFYIDDLGFAYFNDKPALTPNWSLTEGTDPNIFQEFDYDTLHPESNVEQAANDVTLIGGDTRAIRYVEVFEFNGQEGTKSLKAVPFGLDSTIEFYDKFNSNSIDDHKWYENDPNNKITESLGRLQISSLINGTGIIVSKDQFPRDENSEVRFAEFEVVAFGGGKSTAGVHNGTQNNTITNFLHAFEFDQSAGSLRIREGSSVTTFGSIPIGVGVYALRIRIKSTGGAIYYIQGGRTGTPKEYGELGSSTWTKVTETSSDTTPILSLGIYADSTIGCTVIQAKASKQLDVTVTLKAGSKLGNQDPVLVDTVLLCGVESALDFETDCFIQVGDQDPTLNFFTDNLPLGEVKIEYFGTDIVRERVFDTANKTAVDNRSALNLDDGTRSKTIDKAEFITDSQDARNVLVTFLAENAQRRFRGSFTTTTAKLELLVPSGTKPIAGQLLTINLPNSFGINSNELITSVAAEDIGGEIFSFEVQFGAGYTTFDRLMLRLKNATNRQIIDEIGASVPVDSEDVSTANTSRPATPKYVSSFYDDTGLQVVWSSVSGATAYELRDNLYVGQGQGGSFVYQNSATTSFSISAANIKTIHKKRRFTFYIWAIDASSRRSKYPLAITVENPAPVSQPIKDLNVDDVIYGVIEFDTEFEANLTFRKLQYAKSLDMTTSLIEIDNISLTASKTEIDLDPIAINDIYYVRYGVKDSYTDDFNDIVWGGIRQLRIISADGIINVATSVQITDNALDANVAVNELLVKWNIPVANSETYWLYEIHLKPVNTEAAPVYSVADSSYSPTGQVGTGQLTRKVSVLTDTTKSWTPGALVGKSIVLFTRRRPTSGAQPLEGGYASFNITANTATTITFDQPADEQRWSGTALQYYIYTTGVDAQPWDSWSWDSGGLGDINSKLLSNNKSGNSSQRVFRVVTGLSGDFYLFIYLRNYWGNGKLFVSPTTFPLQPPGGQPGRDAIPEQLPNVTEQGLVDPINATALAAFTLSSTDINNDFGVKSNHGLVTGTRVTVSATGGGLDAGKLYYIRKVNSNNISFHLTPKHAYDNANKVDLTASITATITPNGVVCSIIPDLAFPYAHGHVRNSGQGGNWRVSFHSVVPTLTNFSVLLEPGKTQPIITRGDAFTEENPPIGAILVTHDDPTNPLAGALEFYVNWNDGTSPLAGPTGPAGNGYLATSNTAVTIDLA